MGIQGLLPLINAALNTRHISHFKGKRVAVDGYAWLHKAVYGCSQDLALGKENFSWIKYCLKFIDMLLNYEISITMVFDGSNLPLKSETENIRKEKRERAKEKGLELLNKNDKNGARICFTGAVDITPFMAAQLIQILKQHRPTVNFLVAPYEADAQLAYLSINNQVDIVISEDSDTIPFGCKETIFKLNIEGHCQHLLYQDLFKNMENIDLSLFTHEMIIAMCVASGCDYLESCKGIGLKGSYKLLLKHKTVGNVLRTLRLQGQIPLIPIMNEKDRNLNIDTTNASETGSSLEKPIISSTNNNKFYVLQDNKWIQPTSMLLYEFMFFKAVATFRYQTVYDSITKKLRPLHIIETSLTYPNPPSEEVNGRYEVIAIGNICLYLNIDFLGPFIPDTLAKDISEGIIDPVTKLPFDLSKPICLDSNHHQNKSLTNNHKGSIKKVNKINDIIPPVAIQNDIIPKSLNPSPLTIASNSTFCYNYSSDINHFVKLSIPETQTTYESSISDTFDDDEDVEVMNNKFDKIENLNPQNQILTNSMTSKSKFANYFTKRDVSSTTCMLSSKTTFDWKSLVRTKSKSKLIPNQKVVKSSSLETKNGRPLDRFQSRSSESVKKVISASVFKGFKELKDKDIQRILSPSKRPKGNADQPIEINSDDEEYSEETKKVKVSAITIYTSTPQRDSTYSESLSPPGYRDNHNLFGRFLFPDPTDHG